MTYILGLNAYHADAAACLVKDGELVAAVEEERFRRIKHWGGFPSEAIRYCLREAGISLGDVDHVAVNSDNARQPLAQARLRADLGRQPGLCDEPPAQSRRTGRYRRQPEAPPPGAGIPRHASHTVEHHLCHLASAFLVSPFDKAVGGLGRRLRRFLQGGLGTGRRRQRCRSTAGSTSRIRWASSTRR